MHYQIRDYETKKIIIPFDTTHNSTKLSADSNSMYFDLYIESMSRGKSYEIEFLIKDFGNDLYFQNIATKFVID